MNGHLTKIVSICALSLALQTGSPCFCQDNQEQAKEEKPQIKTMSGTVAQVAFVKSFIMVTSELGYLIISVPEGIPISRGKEKIDLDGIDAGDSVIVKYYSPEPGKYIAVSIRDSTPPN
ncbi:MAG: hypothetical protein PHN57_07670 [Candidatus Omnitrophica bacterium]|nr:hypothetical protein [Candidatus Omnitrophota bacterium]